MHSKIQEILQNATQDINQASTLDALTEIEVKYLGRKGQLTELLKGIKDLSAEEKPTIGQAIQNAKTAFTNLFNEKKVALENSEIENQLKNEFFDYTLPGQKTKIGTLHPITIVQREVEEIFNELGFSIFDGPEVDSEHFTFNALNIPSHHPARDMQDTFFVDSEADQDHGKLVLRTHTSSMQVRSMLKFGAPMKAIYPGRVFRFEASDATHDSTFYQVEGVLIDENISLSHLKGLMTEFLRRLLGYEPTIRFRPGYFPFVEPGIELDILWKNELTGKTRWLEFMGAGMIHPNVLKHGNIDTSKYQGWAFGFGLTRLVMIKYGIDDLRRFHENDLRFLQQFK